MATASSKTTSVPYQRQPQFAHLETRFVELMTDKLARHPADCVYTNDPASLSFEGCERFDAIEAVFALQFGRD